MSLPRYEKYKVSGLEWIPQVPLHWDVCALKRVANLKSGDSITSEQISENGEYAVYGGNGLRGFTSSFTHEGRFALIGRQGALCGNINYSQGRFWASEHAVVATPVKPAETTWLGELLRAMNLNQYSVSAAQPGLSVELIANIGVPYPPLHEQAVIGTFLNRETAKIDALIAEQEKLITLLAEKREAAVSHAVTKGLDPNAPMKDSGVAWLGNVPAHWEVMPLKRLLVDTKAGPFGSALTKDMYAASGYRVYGQEQVIPADFSRGDYYINEALFEELQQYAVKPGDILVSCVGTFGKVAIVPEGVEEGIINPRLLRLRVGSTVRSDYLAAVLRSRVAFDQFAMVSRGGTMDVINIGTLNGITLALPPIKEQAEVLEFLTVENAKLDCLIYAAERAIVLLKERRSALITAAVTGQIDVRGAVAPATAKPTAQPCPA